MKRTSFLLIIAVAAVFTANLAAPSAGAETITVQLWSRADRSGPDRAGNIVRAAALLNKQFRAAGVETRVAVEVHENNARGYDGDALALLKAFAVGRGPDLFVAAHEWVGEFAEAGYAMDLEAHIEENPEYYGDIIPALWEAVRYKGRRYAIPQDSEVRMLFFNKEMLRRAGKDDAFIDSLPARVDRGEVTIWDLSRLAKELVDGGIAKYGILHRPNVGPDFLMTFAAFGMRFADPTSGKLLLETGPLGEAPRWFAWNAENGVTPRNNTSMSWDAVKRSWYDGRTFIFHNGVWNVPEQIRAGWPGEEAAYFRRAGWMHVPPSKLGGNPANLSHPIVYCINPNSPRRALAATLAGIASLHYFNTIHAVRTFHTAINHGQAAMPAYRDHWALAAATPLLARASFMPNHPLFGRYNAILFKGLQGVELGRLTPEEGVEFITDEMAFELGEEVIVR